MLVLTRKLQEQISIGQEITITILRVKGNTVKLGIDAPTDVRIIRSELPRFDTSDEQDEQRHAGQAATRDRSQHPHRQPTDAPDRATGLKPIVARVHQRTRALVAG
jgi:carbon storage regulator CsrA